MKKKIISGILVLLIGCLIYGFYRYNKPPQSLEDVKSELFFSAKELSNKFVADQNKIAKRISKKVVEISGVISSVEFTAHSTLVIVGKNIKCEFQKKHEDFVVGKQVSIKGVYGGFDELFNEISLIKCQITN